MLSVQFGAVHIGEKAFECCFSLKTITISGKRRFSVDVKLVNNTRESLKEALKMLLQKDFSRKFSHEAKFILILYYFISTDDEDARAYLKKNAAKLIKQLIETGDVPRLQALLDKTEFVTKRNIDKYIQQAIDCQQQEIFVILTNYKNKIGAYKTPEEEV